MGFHSEDKSIDKDSLLKSPRNPIGFLGLLLLFFKLIILFVQQDSIKSKTGIDNTIVKKYYSSMRHFLFFFLFATTTLIGTLANAQTKILFDNTKAETAGSADWVVDADASKGSAQRVPTPLQSTITSSTPETYWTGALSNWGIDCVNKGYIVESLPSNGKITYGDKTNVQDLSNYKVYIVCEPNILFTATEKTAMLNFVKNGGGLFMISDHAGADRNSDGKDATQIWNDFSDNNGVVKNPFGINFDTTNPNKKLYPSDITEVSTNVTKIGNPITNGSYGTVTKFSYSDGSTMVLDTVANNTVKGVIFANESKSTISGAMVVYARYGKGKIVATGDSSPPDDGTGFTNSGLYKSYSGDSKVGDNHRYMFMNSTIWLATTDTTLPVNFIDVTGKNVNNFAVIDWHVNAINFNDDYTIEQSTDGKNFEVVGSVSINKTNNNGIEHYQWQSKTELEATTYYRIKAVENGTSNYSNVVSISPFKKQQVTIYPNPTSLKQGGEFTIKGLNAGNVISITDLKGQLVHQATAQSSSVVIKNNKLSEGIYFVSIKDTSGNLTSTQKVVVTQ